tara:strand:+ start:1969 stop:2790 length:822 start_codon:yes stop_codon:yes gene_type:complete
MPVSSRYKSLSLKGLRVVEAREYNKVKSNGRKHPMVLLSQHNKQYEIKDRHILFAFLKCIDPTLQYKEMMQTIYDVLPTHRPPLKEILQGYIDSQPKMKIDVWHDEGSIINILTSDTGSKYLQTTYDFIDANYLSGYEKDGLPRISYKGRMYPYMRFTKDNVLRHTRLYKFRINILSVNNNTYIWGTIETPTGATMLVEKYHRVVGWVHTIEAGELGDVLEGIHSSLDKFSQDVLSKLPESIEKKMINADRLNDFHDKTKLQKEYYTWALRGY